MTVENISRSISMTVWSQAEIELMTPRSAIGLRYQAWMHFTNTFKNEQSAFFKRYHLKIHEIIRCYTHRKCTKYKT